MGETKTPSVLILVSAAEAKHLFCIFLQRTFGSRSGVGPPLGSRRLSICGHVRTDYRRQLRGSPPRIISQAAAAHRVPSIHASAAVLLQGGDIVSGRCPWCCARTKNTRRHLNPANVLRARFGRRARAAEQQTCARH